MPGRERVEALIALVEGGHFVEAIEQFYTEDASMQENGEAPRVGRDRLVAHERGVMASFKSIRTMPGSTCAVEGDVAVIRWVFVFTRKDGSSCRMEELAHQRWRGDRIAEERFFYDPGQLQRKD